MVLLQIESGLRRHSSCKSGDAGFLQGSLTVILGLRTTPSFTSQNANVSATIPSKIVQLLIFGWFYSIVDLLTSEGAMNEITRGFDHRREIREYSDLPPLPNAL